MTLWGFDLWAMTLAFARIGALVMLMPGLGEAAVPARVRLGFALLLATMLAPPDVGPAPGLFAATGQIFTEIAVGLVLGGAARIVMSALATAGQILGIETSLAFAQTTDPSQGQANPTISVFLGLLGITLVFAANLHHMFLRGVQESYATFAVGRPFDVGDASEYAMRAFSDAFRIGVQIAAPVIVAGFVFRVGLGVLARLAPTIQVFFVAMPLNILGGFLVMILGLSAGMLVWLDGLSRYTGGG